MTLDMYTSRLYFLLSSVFPSSNNAILSVNHEREREKNKEKQIARTFIDVIRKKTVYNLLPFFAFFRSRTKKINERIDEKT